MPAHSRKGKVQIVNQDGESITLDAKHDEVLARIAREEAKLPGIKKGIVEMKTKLKELRRRGVGKNHFGGDQSDHQDVSKNSAFTAEREDGPAGTNDADASLSEYMDLAEEIQNMRRRAHAIQKKRTNYYLQNSQYIFKYFEQKQSIATETTPTHTTYLLNDFFKINGAGAPPRPTLPTTSASASSEAVSHATPLSPPRQPTLPETSVEDSNKDLQRYLLNINEMNPNLYQSVQSKDVCTHCRKGEMVMYDRDGILICTNCSRITKYIIEHEKPSYKDPPKEVCFYAYKRINHFREILAQFQAKESTQIPEKVLEDFKMQIKKERIRIEQLTNKKAKEILKKLNHSKYYEHVPFIKDKMGIKPPVMDNTLEETLCNLFLEIQAPYAKYCPDSRVNFLNYYYTIYKLCELLDKRQFLEYFPMLKDKSKRIEQDNIWKNICKELNWRFISTV